MKYLYHSYPETVEFFKELATEYSDYVKVESIGETWEKREIILVTISSNIAVADEKPALFYTGTIHAREYIGVELAIAFARYVVDGMQYDPRIREAFERSTIYMVPCANPDGLEYSRNHFSFWRKNRRENADGSIGVDLNRNFSVGFNKNNTPSSNVYSGPHPFSEPETCALKEFVDSHDNITIALDYHSQGNVFFPAHDFRHENTIDTTDMNVLCANMGEEIRKIAGREYGIHQGKPPAILISGSGREYYYSKGIIGTVVEVGTQNISDYLDTMMEHVNEHIPALLVALKEVPNYVKDNPLKRPQEFQLVSVGANEAELSWEYDASLENVYFEIYRSTKYKAPCNKSNLIAVTKSFSYADISLESARQYIYHLRAVDFSSRLKSSFAPGIRMKTNPSRDELSKTLYPVATETGYLGEKTINNKSHFGNNSLLTGVNVAKGECIALLTFPLSSMPDNSIIKSVRLNLYPINRVSATIEKFGEWKVSIIDISNVANIYDFEDVKNAPRITTIGRPTKSQHLTQGIWRKFNFSHDECVHFEKQIGFNEKIAFLMEGPSTLPKWQKSQMMQWDIGYGSFGYGIGFRPHLEVVYSQPATKVEIIPSRVMSVSKNEQYPYRLLSGFEENGKKIFAFFDFPLSGLPSFDRTVIESMYLELQRKYVNVPKDVRYHIEMIRNLQVLDYPMIKDREVVQRIGTEISALELTKTTVHQFPFDSYTIQMIEDAWERGEKISFAVVATSSKRITKNYVVEWNNEKGYEEPKLVVNVLNKRRYPVNKITELKIVMQDNLLRLSWENPLDPDFRGVVVVKNAFRIPKSPYDGQKLYGGKDSYTIDNFGSNDVEKYYAVFSYDPVPNYSEPVWLHYEVN